VKVTISSFQFPIITVRQKEENNLRLDQCFLSLGALAHRPFVPIAIGIAAYFDPHEFPPHKPKIKIGGYIDTLAA
jgi:hypothetical protein